LWKNKGRCQKPDSPSKRGERVRKKEGGSGAEERGGKRTKRGEWTCNLGGGPKKKRKTLGKNNHEGKTKTKGKEGRIPLTWKWTS